MTLQRVHPVQLGRPEPLGLLKLLFLIVLVPDDDHHWQAVVVLLRHAAYLSANFGGAFFDTENPYGSREATRGIAGSPLLGIRRPTGAGRTKSTPPAAWPILDELAMAETNDLFAGIPTAPRRASRSARVVGVNRT